MRKVGWGDWAERAALLLLERGHSWAVSVYVGECGVSLCVVLWMEEKGRVWGEGSARPYLQQYVLVPVF